MNGIFYGFVQGEETQALEFPIWFCTRDAANADREEMGWMDAEIETANTTGLGLLMDTPGNPWQPE